MIKRKKFMLKLWRSIKKYKQNEGSIHKVAAQILGSESCNGWTYWHYQSVNGLKPIDELRQRLRPST